MGAWGADSFENDSALDFWSDLQRADAPGALLREVLKAAASGDLDDVDRCSSAVVAAEIVAGLLGHPSASAPEGFSAWVQQRRESLRPIDSDLARRAVEAVRSDGELFELWSDADARPWLAKLDELLLRLNGS